MVSGDKKDPLGIDKTNYSELYVPVEDNIQLRILNWQHPEADDKTPLVFVAGMVSVVNGWAEVIRALVPKRHVYYVETREKNTARIQKESLCPEDFLMEVYAKDLVQVCRQLPFEQDNVVVAGSSLGATAVLEALKQKQLQVKASFLIGPNSEFRMPWFAKGLFMLPAEAYDYVKYFVLWYLKTFRVDAQKEPEQMKRYDETLKSAHGHRIKNAIKAVMGYEIWDNLNTVDVPVGLAYSTSDKLHTAENIERMARAIPKSTTIPCQSNKQMHSAKIVDEIDTFIKQLEN